MRIFCSVCKDEFFSYSSVSVTCCGHLFHESCINKWCKTSSTCPQCRSELTEKYHNVEFFVQSSEDLKFLNSDLEKLLYELKAKTKEAVELKLKFDNFESSVSILHQIKQDTQKKLDVIENSINLMKQNIEKHKNIADESKKLKEENECLKNKIDFLTKLYTLLHGTEEETYQMLKRTPITPLSIQELCTFVQVMKGSSEKRHFDLRTENLKLSHQVEILGQQLENAGKSIDCQKFLSKSVQTDFLC